MWWREIDQLAEEVTVRAALEPNYRSDSAVVEPGAVLEESAGPIVLGEGVRICTGAVLRGPLVIGDHTLVGSYAMVRGPALIGSRVLIGLAAEIKQALIADRVSIGPQCYVADSRIDADAYLGAQVRTSNQRLDRKPVSVRHNGSEHSQVRDKLGCWIGARACLGIQVIVLPGRVIEPDSVFEPRITISRNYPSGHYRLHQAVELVPQKELVT
jgi:UDP-N-acetylglucosamine diphosphorylase / glucose-1-phosphate thymidylyltransferase / UDP-N-acetylgalactosamine diphosphorylase / glucosamine-1-phosphate N-acetyltransferase / galactosamine-1-phosphate N-acetyltransferase